MTFELLRKIRRTIRSQPDWTKFPQVIQIDTNNFCGPKFCGMGPCSYCYPQWKILQGERQHAEMPTEVIEEIIRQVWKYGRNHIHLIDLFLNGDGETEPRLPELHRFCKKWLPHVPTQTFTCGALPENAHYLMDLDRICFTISAHNENLYRIVHRGNRFNEAIKSLEYVLENKKSSQRVEIHCVLTKDNIPYAKDWWNFFSKYDEAKLILSPLVASWDNLPSKQAMGNYTLDEMEQIVINVAGSEGRMWTRELIPDNKPCVLWDNLSIDVGGFDGDTQSYIMQCCNWYPVKEWNYGKIPQIFYEGKNLKDIWMERLANRMQNPVCESCNMKSPKWRERLNDMKIGE